jgi:hypothetical protein
MKCFGASSWVLCWLYAIVEVVLLYHEMRLHVEKMLLVGFWNALHGLVSPMKSKGQRKLYMSHIDSPLGLCLCHHFS